MNSILQYLSVDVVLNLNSIFYYILKPFVDKINTHMLSAKESFVVPTLTYTTLLAVIGT